MKPLFDDPREESKNKIVYTVHQYEPFAYTHEDSASGNTSFDPSYSDLTTAFNLIREFRQRFKTPVVVNEFGVKYKRPQSATFLKKELTLLEGQKMSHAIWIWEILEGSCADGEFGVNDGNNAAKDLLDVLKECWRGNKVFPSNYRSS